MDHTADLLTSAAAQIDASTGAPLRRIPPGAARSWTNHQFGAIAEPAGTRGVPSQGGCGCNDNDFVINKLKEDTSEWGGTRVNIHETWSYGNPLAKKGGASVTLSTSATSGMPQVPGTLGNVTTIPQPFWVRQLRCDMLIAGISTALDVFDSRTQSWSDVTSTVNENINGAVQAVGALVLARLTFARTAYEAVTPNCPVPKSLCLRIKEAQKRMENLSFAFVQAGADNPANAGQAATLAAVMAGLATSLETMANSVGC